MEQTREPRNNLMHIYSIKVCIVKVMAFSSIHVQMWELDHKEGKALKNWYFQIVILALHLDL